MGPVTTRNRKWQNNDVKWFKQNEEHRSSHLWSNVWGALVDDNLVNFAELSKILMTSENLSITEPRGKPDNKDEVLLYNSTPQETNDEKLITDFSTFIVTYLAIATCLLLFYTVLPFWSNNSLTVCTQTADLRNYYTTALLHRKGHRPTNHLLGVIDNGSISIRPYLESQAMCASTGISGIQSPAHIPCFTSPLTNTET